MDKDIIKNTILEVMEVQLESQLRAVRQMRGEPDSESPLPLRSGKRRQSLVDLSIQILTDEGKPLHHDSPLRMDLEAGTGGLR